MEQPKVITKEDVIRVIKLLDIPMPNDEDLERIVEDANWKQEVWKAWSQQKSHGKSESSKKGSVDSSQQ